jgi:zinc finger protein
MTGSICPVCGESGLREKHSQVEVPYAGKVLEITLQCEKCNYKHVSLDYLEPGEPVRFSFLVEGPQHLSVKVYRSRYGVIELVELGLKVEPGAAADGYLTNVEGVLNRFGDILRQVVRFNSDEEGSPEDIHKALEILEKLEGVKTGEQKVTMVLMDPAGISAIVSDEAKREPLSQEDIEKYSDSFVITFEDETQGDEQ